MIHNILTFIGAYTVIQTIWQMLEKKYEGRITVRKQDTIIALLAAFLITVFLAFVPI